MKFFYCAALLLIFNCSRANACEEFEKKIIDTYQNRIAKDKTGKIDFHSSDGSLTVVCKPWPSKPGFSIIGIPYIDNSSKKSDDDDAYMGLELLIVDAQHHNVVAELNEPRAKSVNAIYPSSLSIDTGLYKVNEKTVAFGVRIVEQNSSSASPFEAEAINLYRQDGAALKNIVNGLYTRSQVGENDGNCDSKRTQTSVSIQILPKKSNDYYDLKIIENISDWKSTLKGGDCQDVSINKHSKTHILSFDGQQYAIPAGLKDEQ